MINVSVFWDDWPSESVTVKMNLAGGVTAVPCSGMPAMTPAIGSSESPGGNVGLTAHLYGGTPPEADNVVA